MNADLSATWSERLQSISADIDPDSIIFNTENRELKNVKNMALNFQCGSPSSQQELHAHPIIVDFFFSRSRYWQSAIQLSGVPDPWHIGTDPDADPAPDPALFGSNHQDATKNNFWRYILHHFSKIKSYKVTKKSRNSRKKSFSLVDERIRIRTSKLRIQMRIQEATKHRIRNTAI